MKEQKYVCYLVGGYIRDKLLGLTPVDKDWVVVGATPEILLKEGYIAVGKEFPVFLNPITKEEYALARKEKKSGTGHTGFICDFSPNISLIEDLARRDLTINAIAEDLNGNLIDPFAGLNDLNNRVLRHVSTAFIEDPLRILRVARFAAKLHKFNFRIADETLAYMQQIVASGELNNLTAERVWLETYKALTTDDPQIYFEVLHQIGALEICFPELFAVFGIPNPAEHHPEIDTGIHTLLALKIAANLTRDLPSEQACIIRYGTICHDLGKALTARELLPKHYGHDIKGLIPTESLNQRLKVPKAYANFALKATQYHMLIARANELKASTILKLFNKLDVWRNPDILYNICLVAEADSKGRYGFENISNNKFVYLNKLYQACNSIVAQPFIKEGLQGEKIALAIHAARIKLIKQIQKTL